MEHTICAQVIAYKVFYIYVERTYTYTTVANLHFLPNIMWIILKLSVTLARKRFVPNRVKNKNGNKWKEKKRRHLDLFWLYSMGEGGGILANYF